MYRTYKPESIFLWHSQMNDRWTWCTFSVSVLLPSQHTGDVLLSVILSFHLILSFFHLVLLSPYGFSLLPYQPLLHFFFLLSYKIYQIAL